MTTTRINTVSRFEYDDVSTLTTFNFYESKPETDQEGVLSKFLSKFKTAVSGPPHCNSSDCDASCEALSFAAFQEFSEKQQCETDQTMTNIEVSKEQDMAAADSSSKAVLRVTSPTPPESAEATPVHVKEDISVVRPSADSRRSVDLVLDSIPLTKTSSCDSDTQSADSEAKRLTKSFGCQMHSARNVLSVGPNLVYFEGSTIVEYVVSLDEQCASHIIQGERVSQGGQLRVCNYCFSKLQAQEQEDKQSIHEAYMYSGNRNSVDLDVVVALSPALSDQKPLSVPTKMQIPTAPLKNHQNEYGGKNSTTLALEIPTGNLLPYNIPMNPSSSPSTPTIAHNEPDTGFKKLLSATNTLLRPRSRTNTMTSLGVDTSLAILDGKQMGSPMPFRRNSLSNNYLSVDGGGGMILPSNEYGSGSENEDDDLRKWDKSPRNLLNFLGGNQCMVDDATTTLNSPVIGKWDSDDDAYDQKIRIKRKDELRSRERPNGIIRRLSVTGGAARPIRARTQSLMRNAPIMTGNGQDGISPTVRTAESTACTNIGVTQNTSGRQTSNYVQRHARASSVPVSIELNAASLDHMRKLLKHMLNEIQEDLGDSYQEWEDVLLNLLLKVSDNVLPDIRGGDEIDIRHYVKIKKIAGGRPKDSLYVKGVVCSKNVAHKQMMRVVNNPQILILLFPLEWSRDYSRGEQQFQSIQPVLDQEKDYLEKLVNRIVLLKPSIVLVSSNVSRLALDFLLKANIVVVYNVKLSVLDAVARCTGASIISSFLQLNKDQLNKDQLNKDELKLGHCGSFEVRTLMHELIPNRRKTFLMFQECPANLGATIILRGGKMETLREIKRVLDFMVFVAHNLKLESFLQKDFAKIRNAMHPLNTTSEYIDQVTLVDKLEDSDGSLPEEVETIQPKTEDDTCLKHINELIDKYKQVTLSASPMVKSPPPYLLLRLRETERELVALIRKRSSAPESPNSEKWRSPSIPSSLSGMHNYFRAFDQYLANDPNYDQLLEEHHHRWRALEACIGDSTETLSPVYHQQLVVLYTSVCGKTGAPCQGPELRLFEYYRPGSDLTLGQYIEDTVADADSLCPSNICERNLQEHYRTYAHCNAKVNVAIQLVNSSEPIMMSSIHTWSRCKLCTVITPAVAMSENSWKYSFGKFLELMFYQSDPSPRPDVCPHDFYRHHVHYFGFKHLLISLEHDDIEPMEVHVPPMHLYVNPTSRIAAKDAALESTRAKIVKFYESVVERNKCFIFDIVLPNMVEPCKEQLQEMSRRATEEKKQMLQSLQSVYATTLPTDILSLNVVRVQLQTHVVQWDLKYAEFVRQYVRPERELRRLTANHFKKMLPVETIMAMPVSSLDLRTKRATEAADLPLLDVGLDDGETYNCDGPSIMQTKEEEPSLCLKHLPSLGESPTSIPLWLEGETRINELLQRMHDRHMNASKQEPLQEAIDKMEEEASQLLDPSVARRLSLELMKDSPPWQEGQRYDGKGKAPIGLERTSILSQHSSVLPLLSSSACKRLAGLLPEATLTKSKSSPPLGSSLLLSPGAPEPSRTTTRKRTHKPTDLSLPRDSTIAQDTPSRPEGKKELPLSGYRYGYRGSTERGNTAQFRPRPRPTTADHASKRGEKKPETVSAIPSQRTIKFSKNVANAAKSRGTRQRLPSKSSIEVYKTIREIVHEESDDEFQATDVDDQTDVEDDNESWPAASRTFSLTRTDEYDEALGRDFMPSIHHLPRFNHMFSSSLPHLSFDQEDRVHDKVEHHHTISDFRLMRGVNASPVDVPKPNSFMSLDSIELPSGGSERNSFIRTITNMLAEKGLANLPPLEYPLSPLEHVVPGYTIVVGEDEPSTIIAYSLSCDDYLENLRAIRESYAENTADEISISEESVKTAVADMADTHMGSGMFIERTLRSKSGSHMKYCKFSVLYLTLGTDMTPDFSDGTTKFFCKMFFVEQFDALRRNCGCEETFVSSLASCCKWDSYGGKSGSLFLKTKDDRFLIKQISKYEMDAFLRFAPSYFQYMSESFFHELPTVLCKIFGLYRIGFKNTTTGRSMRMDILVMENLFYQRVVKKIFDLKGSMRNRHVQETGKENEVLLDENMVELMYQSPYFLRSHSKEMLRGSLHNDTLFLSRLDVMDYSLLVGVDEEKQELVVGIVDFIRTFTWDKKLESWVKESGILGGGGKEPTIISPKQYRIRFREAMDRYFLMVPDFWTSMHMRIQHHAPQHHHVVQDYESTQDTR
ncbi:1-phosphatidylinositol-3-phosphate 5-kinase [Apophysomyces sp. BC1015]|nr:1-phosphatidylinositol-3-phosphate 5-kinase [Apophysomyces sp. BC1015]